MTPLSLNLRSWTELGLLALIWGASFLSIRVALDEIGPLTSVLFRTGIAMAVLWTVVAALRLPVPTRPALWGALLVMGWLNNAIPFTLMAWAQVHIPTGLTAILNATTAIFGVVVAALCFADERLTLSRVAGVCLGFAGVSLAIGPGALLSMTLTSLAQVAVLAGTLSYACASAWARQHLRGLPPVVAAAGMLTGSTLTMVPVALLSEPWPGLSLQTDTWIAIGYFSILGTALAYLLYYRVLAMAGAGNLMMVTLLIPPVAIVLGAWLRAEVLSATAFAGLALIALGLVLIDGRLLRRAKPV